MNFQLDSPIFLKDFLKYKNAKFLVPYNTNYKIEKIVLDSRTYSGRGGIFFAIVGKKHDGHRFINEIIDRIDFIVISNKNFLCKEHKDKFIITDNTTLALNFLAHLYRSKFN
ncbi:MAG: hypothetical protein N2643_04195 [Endomicrobia bacterium]|nr:hypothetical protein [Endomicrobiia bacterium]